jgi:hypothetical protein
MLPSVNADRPPSMTDKQAQSTTALHGSSRKRPLGPIALSIVFISLMLVSLYRVQTNRPHGSPTLASNLSADLPAPLFTATDSSNRLFRMQSLLGRHSIALVFVPAEGAASLQRWIKTIEQQFAHPTARVEKLVLVTSALPKQIRDALPAAKPPDLICLSDPTLDIHQLWEVYPSQAQAILIGRSGNIAGRQRLQNTDELQLWLSSQGETSLPATTPYDTSP